MKYTHGEDDLLTQTRKLTLSHQLVRKNRLISSLLTQNQELRETIRSLSRTIALHRAKSKEHDRQMLKGGHLEKVLTLQHKLLETKDAAIKRLLAKSGGNTPSVPHNEHRARRLIHELYSYIQTLEAELLVTKKLARSLLSRKRNTTEVVQKW